MFFKFQLLFFFLSILKSLCDVYFVSVHCRSFMSFIHNGYHWYYCRYTYIPIFVVFVITNAVPREDYTKPIILH